MESIVHKIGLKILLGWVLFLPITAYSLGLGDIDVKSFLNQPLRADISIISARPGEIDDLLVGLADRKAFSRASLSRPSHLSALKFKVVKSDDGTSAVISVKTQTAVKEPVLNFLVEADWSKGKVFREFTILLDPPYFAQQAAKPLPKAKPTPVKTKAANKPQAMAKVEDVSQPEPIVNQSSQENASNNGYVNESAVEDEYNYDIANTEPAEVENNATNNNASVNAQDSISIIDGATLWSVAKTLKTDNVSMSQIMLSLQRLNQEAFGKDNINNLKQGAVLRVPTEQDMTALSQREAYEEVLNQNGLWNDYLVSVGHASANASNTQVDGTADSANDSAKQEKDGALSIVASGEGDSDKAALRSDSDVQQISNLKKQLLLSEEEAESVRVERDELSSRVQMLEAELAKRNELQNLVTVQDDSLASMEQQLAKANESAPGMIESEEPDVTVSTEAEMVQENTDEVMTDSAMPIDTMTENMNEASEVESTDVMQSDDTAMTAEPEIIVEDSSIQEAAPIIVSEPSSSSSMVDDIIQAVISNPLVQGGIAVILLVILLLTKFLKGRQSKPVAKQSDSIEDILSEDPIDTQSGIIIPNVDDEDETPINVPQMEEDQPVDDFSSTIAGMSSTDEDDDEDPFSKTAIISADDMSTIEADSAELSAASEASDDNEEQDETLDEVDVYLAYSLFENAEDLLKEKLVESPNRADYRAKLLDTYFATQNTEAYSDEAKSLKDLGGSADKYWAKVQTMGFELDPSNPMFAGGEGGDIADLAIAKPEMADFDIGAGDDDLAESDFDLSLDGDDTNFDLSKDVDSEDQGLEFNLDDDLLDENTSDSNELPDDLGGLDFDINDLDETSEVSIDEELSVDDGLEFNLDDAIDIEDDAQADVDPIEKNDDEGLEFSIADIEIGEDELEINAFDNDELDINIDDIEPEIDLSGEEATSSMEQVDDSLDFNEDLSIEIDNEDIVLDADDQDETLIEIDGSDDLDDSEFVVEDEIDFSETAVISPIEDLEQTSIMDTLDVADETSVMSAVEIMDDDLTDKTDVISTLDIEDELVIPDIEDELVIPDLEDELVIPDIDVLDEDEDITDIGNIEGLMLPDDVDEVATKLDLAKAFQDMGDSEGARSSLEEVLEDGTDAQKAEAEALLKQLSE